MRLLFFIMLLVNAGVFAFLMLREPGANPTKPALPALHAERIQLVPTDPNTAKLASLAALDCVRWSGFTPEKFAQARTALDGLSLADKLSSVPSEEYWVYMPPLKNQREAEKKLSELKVLKIEDGVLVDEKGPWQYAISFAVFASEESALIRLNQLKEQGVRTAKIVKRENNSGGFLIQQADAKLVAALNKLQEGFPETNITSVACAAPKVN